MLDCVCISDNCGLKPRSNNRRVVPSRGGTRPRGANSNNNKGDDGALLARELNELTVQQREDVYEELHGVSQNVAETPEQLERSLAHLHEELAKIPKRRRHLYTRALLLRPGLEQDTEFFLKFLRADRFDTASAANRICSFFDTKFLLFGEEKLVKRITLDDLDEDDMECFRHGAIQVLPQKDRSGRAIWFIDLTNLEFKDWKNQVRANLMSTSVCILV